MNQDNGQGATDGPTKYRDKRMARFAAGDRVKEFQAFQNQAERRLDYLETACSKFDLMKLPSNCFEALRGARQGQFSIRINKQWRVCFEWSDNHPRPFNIELYFPQLSNLHRHRSEIFLLRTPIRNAMAGVANSRPSLHDDGYQTTPYQRGTGHAIVATVSLAVSCFRALCLPS